ncbi:TetR/AcrR family transcriptional regulator [Mycolicibacterium smegmatis]|uniref:Transcriptional regulator n=2 Tax=Mycolicibacterium smegmatis (strain ATCC 700084 / mc(2)155) TaxID=246196 RepID=A0R2Z0_MYCS2|nr:TetR family transcriptional regulator [Mycolicibacterium smegmatis]ABK69747.1 transcriptional regulator [Mycolicibacterium smegmatis MC2 155]AFP41587.1 TetR-family transcriptional regulator [Mycolicibacterium smegmatis MC2 155]AIU10314.1 TetR family transcriptional regulator [Mycolicibacterium smegmatis MC2 155]AIU16939.1 TetR family transcriptional regulator [Mycolicibacterium smegmatis]AIU23562.1 TetR family transcriptional regulator [Mycolicibacterium smegmatis]
MVKRSARATPGPRDDRGVLAARILAAARETFAESGWAGTTIRAVARAADVDPALVYHYYGSKEGLLDAATDPPQKWLDAVVATWQAPVGDTGRAVLRLLLDSWADDEVGPVLRAILQTAAHEPTTHEKLRKVVERSLIGVIATMGDDERVRRTRAGLVASQTIGFALMRYVWRIEPVASMREDEVLDAVGPTLQRYIDGDIGAAGQIRTGFDTA